MKHAPNPPEQQVLDDLLDQFQFEAVLVRLTATMLKKSIIDARGPLQALLARSGIIEYAAVQQGPEFKIQLVLPFIATDASGSRTYSFYRPKTKLGDPRVWIERLASFARAGELLVFAFAPGSMVAFLLTGPSENLASKLSRYLPPADVGSKPLQQTILSLARKLIPLRERWVKTLRAGPTGVGYTLESLLGVRANVSRLADVDGVELKAYRRGALAGSGKLVTLFSKTPNWSDGSKGAGLLERFGYHDPERNRRALYCTITVTANTLGLQLVVRHDEGRVLVANRGTAFLSYSLRTLSDRLREKHPATLFVKASYRGRGIEEEFLYEEVVLCREPSFANFVDLIEEGGIGLDFTLHRLASGRARDHGYLWRIRESMIPSLYAYRRVLDSTFIE